jgi:hypothetical protein
VLTGFLFITSLAFCCLSTRLCSLGAPIQCNYVQPTVVVSF